MQDQGGDAVGPAGRGRERPGACIRLRQQDGPLRGGVVQDGEQEPEACLQVERVRRCVPPGPGQLETDQAPHPGEPLHQAPAVGVVPVCGQVRPGPQQHDVRRSLARQVVGDPGAGDLDRQERRRVRTGSGCGRSGRGQGRLRHDLHVGQEAVPPAVVGPDEHLGLPVVAEGASRLLDAAGHRGLADEATAPDLVHELFLGHHAAPVRDEVDEHVERLRLQRYDAAVVPELETVGVQLERSEAEGHRERFSRGSGREPTLEPRGRSACPDGDQGRADNRLTGSAPPRHPPVVI